LKLALATLVFALLSAGSALSQNAQKAGDWSVYADNGPSSHTQTLLQTSSRETYTNNRGELVHAELDVICAKGKLIAIVADMKSAIPQDSVDKSGPVYTMPVSYQMGDQKPESASWAISDHGQTLSPYAQIMQNRLTRKWAARLAASNQLTFGLGGSETTVTFGTAGFSQALSAAGCGY